MNREDLEKQMKSLKQKAQAARKAGKGDNAKSFRAGAKRLSRQLRAMKKPQAASAKKAAEA
ncbi:MAG: hypothetical protein JW841_03530 [Deltaproteobacteria bacterium]|nr:hypothetical protein [Deltaproteobacteria bacterium]